MQTYANKCKQMQKNAKEVPRMQKCKNAKECKPMFAQCLHFLKTLCKQKHCAIECKNVAFFAFFCIFLHSFALFLHFLRLFAFVRTRLHGCKKVQKNANKKFAVMGQGSRTTTLTLAHWPGFPCCQRTRKSYNSEYIKILLF